MRLVHSEAELHDALSDRAQWIGIASPFAITRTIDPADFGDSAGWPMRWDSAGPHGINLIRKCDGPAFRGRWGQYLIWNGVSIHEDPDQPRPYPLVEVDTDLSVFRDVGLLRSGGPGLVGGSHQFAVTRFEGRCRIEHCAGPGLRITNAVQVSADGLTLQFNGEPSLIRGGGEDPESRGPMDWRDLHIEDDALRFENVVAASVEASYLWASRLELGPQTEGCRVIGNHLWDSEIIDEAKRHVTVLEEQVYEGWFGFLKRREVQRTETVSANKVQRNVQVA